MLVSTPAIVLHSFKYGDTSKIVRLLTREHGVQSAIAKGAFRPKSRFGARLQFLSQGSAQLYIRQTRDLQTLAGFDLSDQRTGLTQHLERYAAASALAELVLRLSPAERHPEIFDLLAASLDRLEQAPAPSIPAIGLLSLWSMVSALGFAPSVERCARDGRVLPEGAGRFSLADGGLLCSACASGTETSKLPAEDRAALEALLEGKQDIGPLTPRRAAAHRRLLARFVRRHAAEERELKALQFWEAGS